MGYTRCLLVAASADAAGPTSNHSMVGSQVRNSVHSGICVDILRKPTRVLGYVVYHQNMWAVHGKKNIGRNADPSKFPPNTLQSPQLPRLTFLEDEHCRSNLGPDMVTPS